MLETKTSPSKPEMASSKPKTAFDHITTAYGSCLIDYNNLLLRLKEINMRLNLYYPPNSETKEMEKQPVSVIEMLNYENGEFESYNLILSDIIDHLDQLI